MSAGGGESGRATPVALLAVPSRVAFVTLTALFCGVFCWLGLGNNDPGSPDSVRNLVAARRIYSGLGFTSQVVGQLWIRESIPGPEASRTPGLPFLLAGMFALAGPSLAVPVLLNVALVALTGIVLRRSIALHLRSSGIEARLGAVLSNTAGLVFLLSRNYELVSSWNNNLLTLLAAIGLLLAAGERGRNAHPGRQAVVWSIWVAGLAYVKYTYLPAGGLLGLWFLAAGARHRGAVRATAACVSYLVLVGVLLLPYASYNLRHFGVPLYSPYAAMRVAYRWGRTAHGRSVRFDRPMSIAERFAPWGMREKVQLIRAEMDYHPRTMAAIAWLNPGVVALGLLCCRGLRRSDLRQCVAAGALALTGYAECAVISRLEFRYLWPVFPCLLFVASISVGRYLSGAPVGAPSPAVRRTQAAVMLLAVITALWSIRPWLGAASVGPRVGSIPTLRSVPTPQYAQAVRELTPGNARILTEEPWNVAWWTERDAVIAPFGTKRDLEEVLAFYHPEFYLSLRNEAEVGFEAQQLSLIKRGGGFRLYRVIGH